MQTDHYFLLVLLRHPDSPCNAVIQMWQSRVEIEHYSVAYFARIAAFEAL